MCSLLAEVKCSFELAFTSREKILETVVEADPSLLNPDASSSASVYQFSTYMLVLC